MRLEESQDFRETRSSEARGEARREIKAARQALGALLTARRGAPEDVELRDHLDITCSALRAPAPLGTLCAVAGPMPLRHLPGTGRWAGLAIGQAAPEFPITLLLAVGETSALAPKAPGEG
ncbi:MULTISPECIES: hypothetical protein [Kitasatospora]|uniref:Uncharacterized protein n=1 Tax=Kitasatospora setae (strain ATCC 33774 / DSM 43861 / JCM 3304 / KCC A-0304 / NBRC 14216 / KM-6054) TaxID=452652 RepID=E4NJ32_KITSK|nr:MULTISPECIES: hypothetical protein [Kitasatospora]BAJ32980.1 hypothetical protein KSE_72250 [Kitasatospora setae KM-6054]